MSFSHRDHRTHRTVGRAFGTIVVVVSALTAFALAASGAALGLAAVATLVAVGGGYLLWSDRVLSDYTRDVSSARQGSGSNGFVRVEVASTVGVDREVARPTSRSPNSRWRRPGGSAVERAGPIERFEDPHA